MDIDDIKIVQQLGELVASVRYINNSLEDVHRQLDAIYTRLTRLETTLSAHLNEQETRGGGNAGGGSEKYCGNSSDAHNGKYSHQHESQSKQQTSQTGTQTQPKPAHKFTLLKLAALIPIVVPIAVFIVLVVVPLINSLANQ